MLCCCVGVVLCCVVLVLCCVGCVVSSGVELAEFAEGGHGAVGKGLDGVLEGVAVDDAHQAAVARHVALREPERDEQHVDLCAAD